MSDDGCSVTPTVISPSGAIVGRGLSSGGSSATAVVAIGSEGGGVGDSGGSVGDGGGTWTGIAEVGISSAGFFLVGSSSAPATVTSGGEAAVGTQIDG